MKDLQRVNKEARNTVLASALFSFFATFIVAAVLTRNPLLTAPGLFCGNCLRQLWQTMCDTDTQWTIITFNQRRRIR